MERREMIKKMSFYMGGALSAPMLAAILEGCSNVREASWTPTYFSQEQAYVIEDITEIIMPATDTPGAKDVGVPAFIENMVRKVMEPKDTEKFFKGFDELDKKAKADFGDSFLNLSESKKLVFVKSLNADLVDYIQDKKGSWEDVSFFRTIKEFTLLGYFTSEAGATLTLQYDPIPGEYHGCVPLDEVGKAWAT